MAAAEAATVRVAEEVAVPTVLVTVTEYVPALLVVTLLKVSDAPEPDILVPLCFQEYFKVAWPVAVTLKVTFWPAKATIFVRGVVICGALGLTTVTVKLWLTWLAPGPLSVAVTVMVAVPMTLAAGLKDKLPVELGLV